MVDLSIVTYVKVYQRDITIHSGFTHEKLVILHSYVTNYQRVRSHFWPLLRNHGDPHPTQSHQVSMVEQSPLLGASASF